VIFTRTALDGLIVLRAEPRGDARGDFARLWCAADFAAAGVPFAPSQISLSRNHARHTLRGLHWQAAPHAETKLVRPQAGRIFDVAADLRPGSRTYRQWLGLELDAGRMDALLIPAGFAHGFLTLTENAEVLYMIDTPYAPAAVRGARFDDPALGIVWPAAPALVGEKDLLWPAL